MKAKNYLFIIFLAVSLTISAQQKKVAVYMTGEDSGVNKVLGDQLVAAFARSGKYVAVERTASFLAELGKEHSYQRSGAVSDNQIAALGVQFGVNYVCVADVSEVFGEKYISARLIDVETAEIVNTHNVSGQMNSMSKCLEMANEIAKILTKGTFAEQAEFKQAEALRLKEAKERRLAELKAQGFVDLGLPSGTLWKNENEIGGRENLFSYKQAVNQFGNRLPTKKQLEELIYQCRWTKEYGGYDYKVIGPNGNSISLHRSGSRGTNGVVYAANFAGYYWSSTPSSSNDVWLLYIDDRNIKMIYNVSISQGLSVRLVQNP